MSANKEQVATIFLCGDVMTGRGIDQILPHPSEPRIYEEVVSDARTYIQLAEQVNGPVPRPVAPTYVWGDALVELQQTPPDARAINLETSVTLRDEPCPKGINYRMNPANVDCLTAASIDVCTLANNHVLDYGPGGLVETLESLERAGVKTAGAGRTLAEARQPAIVDLPRKSRLVVHALGSVTSGIPHSWAADDTHPGINLLADLSDDSASRVTAYVRHIKLTGDVTIASVHWGSNWGYEVAPAHVRFAHRLIDGGIDIVHGHSSHHPRPIEVYRGRLILYGCGDFLNDYEGISGFDEYRGDLALMYFATVSRASGKLVELRMVPMQIRKMRLRRAEPRDARWLADRLAEISMDFGARTELRERGLFLRWNEAAA